MKGLSLPINTMIILAVALLVLIVAVVIVMTGVVSPVDEATIEIALRGCAKTHYTELCINEEDPDDLYCLVSPSIAKSAGCEDNRCTIEQLAERLQISNVVNWACFTRGSEDTS